MGISTNAIYLAMRHKNKATFVEVNGRFLPIKKIRVDADSIILVAGFSESEKDIIKEGIERAGKESWELSMGG